MFTYVQLSDVSIASQVNTSKHLRVTTTTNLYDDQLYSLVRSNLRPLFSGL